MVPEPRRIVVFGTESTGKTALAAALARRFGERIVTEPQLIDVVVLPPFRGHLDLLQPAFAVVVGVLFVVAGEVEVVHVAA